MGLAQPKQRMKLSHDPNNTKWTNDTQSFGHRMMTSQGWQPGDHLGVKDAAHAEFHTDANFSHIRVAIKDDNLGLGAKIGSGVGPGECTGLFAFQTLLGRLNGKDEDELEREVKSREDLKRAIYTEQRWGSIRFVKGGLLVGDKIQPLIEAEKERVRKLEEGNESDSSSSSASSSDEEEEKSVVVMEKSKKSKKRKLEDAEESTPEVVTVTTKKMKKRKLEKEGTSAEVIAVKIKKSKKQKSSESDEEVTSALKEVKLSKKESKRDKETKKIESEDTSDGDEEARSKQRKKEKKEKKEKKRSEKREKKEKAKAAAAVDGESAKESSKSKSKSKSKRDKKKKSKKEEDDDSDSSSGSSNTPAVTESSGRSTPMVQGMHAIRARNIAQKRMASMDVAALNQIFMIKSQV